MLSFQAPLVSSHRCCFVRPLPQGTLLTPCCAASKKGTAGLSKPELKDLRRAAQDLARQQKLVITQIGKKGITDAFVENLDIALEGNNFVKVKAGGCDVEVDDLMEILEERTDSTCVHKIGHTATFYRKTK